MSDQVTANAREIQRIELEISKLREQLENSNDNQEQLEPSSHKGVKKGRPSSKREQLETANDNQEQMLNKIEKLERWRDIIINWQHWNTPYIGIIDNEKLELLNITPTRFPTIPSRGKRIMSFTYLKLFEILSKENIAPPTSDAELFSRSDDTYTSIYQRWVEYINTHRMIRKDPDIRNIFEQFLSHEDRMFYP